MFERTASPPGWMDPVVTSMSSNNLRISWSLPNVTNGADVDRYRILVLEKDHYTFTEFPSLCNGTNDFSIVNWWCDIPMNNITANLLY